MSDEKLTILHLYIAVVGGVVIAVAGFVGFAWSGQVPLLSFIVGPAVSWTALAGLRGLKAPARKR